MSEKWNYKDLLNWISNGCINYIGLNINFKMQQKIK